MNDVESDPDLESIESLRTLAREMGNGAVQIGIFEEALRLAEMRAVDVLTQSVREELIRAAIFGGRADLALVVFSRYLAYCDEHPESTNDRTLLWQYKWMVGHLPCFYNVTRKQIEDAFDDFARRVEIAGYTRSSVNKLRLSITLGTRDYPLARQAFQEFHPDQRDDLSDCVACVAASRVYYLIQTDQIDRAIKTAQPILKGKLSCHYIPQATYASLLEPLLKSNQLAYAAELCRKCAKLTQTRAGCLDDIAEVIEFLARTLNTVKSLNLIRKYLAQACEAAPDDQFCFYTASAVALAIAGDHGSRTISLVVPASAPFFREGGKYPIRELQHDLEKLAGELADQFDARNGNSWHRDYLSSSPTRRHDLRPYPIAKSSRTS